MYRFKRRVSISHAIALYGAARRGHIGLIFNVLQQIGKRGDRNHLKPEAQRALFDRYKSSLIQAETDLLACMRYVELKAVRAAMMDNVKAG